MNLPSNAKRIIDLLISSGYSAYAVGGCVRDSVMGRQCGDVDITTSALPLQIEQVLESDGIRYIETGLKHGTITAVLEDDNYEITTFRTDGDYGDNRHPDSVSFVTSIEDDLARRDFTINAMAYNDSGMVDLYGGMQDIDARLIRCVGDPDTRFREDALRIMRGLRFASVLGFSIEPVTAQAIHSNKELLGNIASERIFVELKKLLLGENVEQILLEYRDVLAVIIPELERTFDFPQHSKWHLYDVYTHTAKSVAFAPKVEHIRMALLLHDIGKPYTLYTDSEGCDHFKGHPAVSTELSQLVLKRLKVSNIFFNKVITLVENHDRHIHANTPSIKHWLSVLGEELIYDFVDVKIADMSSHNLALAQEEMDELYQVRDMIESVISSGEPYSISQLAIHGNDLIPLGYRGKEIAMELSHLLDIVMSDPSQNEKQLLLSLAQEHKLM